MTTSSMSTSTTTGQPTSTTQGEASTTDQAKHVATVATDEVKQVAGDVREQARGLLDETKNQVQDQSRAQRDRVVETLRTFGDDLDNMAEQRGGLASDAAREVAQRARAISQRLDGREPAELLEDLRSFARRRPAVFLAGAAISGVVVGRLLRGTRDAAQVSTSSGLPNDGADATTTQERRVVPAYDPIAPTMTSPPAAVDQPVGMPTVPAESGRPVGGP